RGKGGGRRGQRSGWQGGDRNREQRGGDRNRGDDSWRGGRGGQNQSSGGQRVSRAWAPGRPDRPREEAEGAGGQWVRGDGRDRSRQGGGQGGRDSRQRQWQRPGPSRGSRQDRVGGSGSGYGEDAYEQQHTAKHCLNFCHYLARYGVIPVLKAFQEVRRYSFLELFVQEGIVEKGNKKDKQAVIAIQQLAEELGVRQTYTDKGSLNSLCRNRPHQGFVLRAKPLEFEVLPRLEPPSSEDLDRYSTKYLSALAPHTDTGHGTLLSVNAQVTPPVWLALDEVTDPQNFGALLRSAYFFGASGVVCCAKNSAGLTPVVSKASAGVMEVMTVHNTPNMMKFLRESRENGWRVIGTAVGETCQPLQAVAANAPTIVVLGSEGYGLRRLVARECETLVEVGGAANLSSSIESLNVSVCGGILLYHLCGGAPSAAAPTASVVEDVAQG
ncbi:unnamed protein product, partial [Chrysoparadoxa australica]